MIINIIAAFVVAFFVIGIVLLYLKKLTLLGKILILLSVTTVLLFALLYTSLVLALFNVYGVYYIAGVIALTLSLFVFTCSMLFNKLRKKVVYIPIITAAVICCMYIAGIRCYEVYINSIPTLAENDSILFQEYAPYAENTKAVNLNEESKLKLNSDLPVMDGATALFPIYSAFAKAVYPKDKIDNIVSSDGNNYLKCNKTAAAYENIVDGSADIIFVAAPSEEQKKYAEEKGVELVYTPIGKEAFVFFVNSRNPLEDISVDNIKNIYSGDITLWEQLDVQGLGEILAYQRPEGSGSQSALIRLMDGKYLKPAPKTNVMVTMGGIIETTADYKNHKNAIGYSFRFYADEMVNNNQIKLLKINGIYPNTDNIENGSYPISSEFYAVTRKDMSDNTGLLLEWILGEQGQSIIEKTGYTPLN